MASRATLTKHKNSIILAASVVIPAAIALARYTQTKLRSSKMAFNLHPSINNGFAKGSPDFKGGKLHCKCQNNPVEVTLAGQVLHNHACGCSKCWKPDGALFSVIAVIPRDQVSVTANADKLYIVDESAAIQRNACSGCGVHLFGRIEKDHAFKGLDFVHVELSDEKGWQEPQFAAFVSSIIEQGFNPDDTPKVRAQFQALGLDTYDALSPPLMDALATYAAQKAGIKPHRL